MNRRSFLAGVAAALAAPYTPRLEGPVEHVFPTQGPFHGYRAPLLKIIEDNSIAAIKAIEDWKVFAGALEVGGVDIVPLEPREGAKATE